MAEAGYPGVELDYWFGIFAPTGTPDAIVNKLNDEFRKAASLPLVVEAVRSQAAELVTGSPEEFSELVKVDGERLRKIVNEVGAKTD